MCAIQKLKIHVIAYYSNATSLWKGVPALRHLQNMLDASELRRAVIEWYFAIQKFIVTVELLYDQAESDFVQCQTKMRAFASRMCSEFKQIELNWNSKNFKFKCFMESGLLYNPTMKQTNLRAGCKSTLQPGMMTDRLSQIFEDLVYLFSSEDKYKGISLY